MDTQTLTQSLDVNGFLPIKFELESHGRGLRLSARVNLTYITNPQLKRNLHNLLEVTFNQSEQTAIDWQLVRQANGIESILNVAGQLLGGAASSGQGRLSLQRNSGSYAGPGALLQALQQQGVVQKVISRYVPSN